MIRAATAEILIFIFGLTLNIFAFPTILDKTAAVPRIQSLVSAISLTVISLAYVTLGLLLPATSVGLGAVVWLFIFVYRPTDGKWLGIKTIIERIK